jgi:carboxymethylenebutenolidase
MRILLVALLALLLPAMASLARGAEGKGTGKDITFTSGDEKIKGYLAVPEGKGPFPAVVVIQEWWASTTG